MKGKEHRALDSDIESDLISAGPSLQPQGRAFTNFVTVAPKAGDMPQRMVHFDLDDVSLDGQDEEAGNSGEELQQQQLKKTEEVTCSHEGKTFKVRINVNNGKEDVL